MHAAVKKLVSSGKVFVGAISLLCTFCTVIDLMLFLSDPNYNQKKISNTDNNTLWSWALLTDMCLISLFIFQHSFLALPQIKHIISNYKLQDLQRSIYVITTCIVLQVLIKNWLYTEFTIWSFNIETGLFYWLYYTLHILAWLLIYIGSICMDVNEMLGLKQIYYSVRNLPEPTSCKSYELQRLYSHMRHPSFVAFTIIFWFTPVLSLDRLLLAFITSSYMYITWKTDDADYQYQEMQYRRKFL